MNDKILCVLRKYYRENAHIFGTYKNFVERVNRDLKISEFNKLKKSSIDKKISDYCKTYKCL